jgi:hypothetical protein
LAKCPVTYRWPNLMVSHFAIFTRTLKKDFTLFYALLLEKLFLLVLVTPSFLGYTLPHWQLLPHVLRPLLVSICSLP